MAFVACIGGAGRAVGCWSSWGILEDEAVFMHMDIPAKKAAAVRPRVWASLTEMGLAMMPIVRAEGSSSAIVDVCQRVPLFT